MFYYFFAVRFSIAQQINNKSAADKYRAVHLGVNEGLSYNAWNYMLKDVNGFLWISGQNGLNRFDGTTFKYYFPDNKKSGAIRDIHPFILIEDSLHNIWMNTDKGLSRYDIRADTFTNSFPVISNFPFWATKDEVYCFEQSNIIAYNIHSLTKRILAQLTPDIVSCGGASLSHSIFDAGSNSIWMLEGGSLPDGGLCQISISDQQTFHYSLPCFKKNRRHSDCAEGMCYDKKRNSIWINSSEGLIQFTLEDKQFHHIDPLNNLPDLKDYNKSFEHWAGITLDPQGRVWRATVRKGIVIYDPATQSADSFPLEIVRFCKKMLLTLASVFTATVMA